MVRINILAFCLASVFVLNFVNCEVENGVGSEITSVDFVEDISQFLIENPNAQMLEKVAKVPNTRNQITYRLGTRISGDRMVAETSASQQWSSLQDVTTSVFYPTTGTGAIITYVQINVDQTSNFGRAYIVSGGIGQRAIKVVIEAQRTLAFRHLSTIYGY